MNSFSLVQVGGRRPQGLYSGEHCLLHQLLGRAELLTSCLAFFTALVAVGACELVVECVLADCSFADNTSKTTAALLCTVRPPLQLPPRCHICGRPADLPPQGVNRKGKAVPRHTSRILAARRRRQARGSIPRPVYLRSYMARGAGPSVVLGSAGERADYRSTLAGPLTRGAQRRIPCSCRKGPSRPEQGKIGNYEAAPPQPPRGDLDLSRGSGDACVAASSCVAVAAAAAS